MISSRTLIIGFVGAGCIAAAGIGGYVAVKSDASSAAPLAPQAAIQAQAPAPVVDAPLAVPAVPTSSRPAVESKPAPRVTKAAASQAREVRPPAVTPEAPPLEKPSERTPDESSSPAEDVARKAAPVPEMNPVTAVEPAKPEVEELTVHADAVIGLRLSSPVSTETARIEDRVSARVTRDVVVDGRTAIPAGATLDGTVTQAQRGGKFKERARLGIRFTSVVLANNARFPIQTETIFRVGEAPTGEATSKIGASAVVGAILGAVIGGKKGAAIGTTAGAAGGTAAVMATGGNEVVIAAGAPLTVRLTAPATILVERER